MWFLHENINHIHKLGWNSIIEIIDSYIDVDQGHKDMLWA